MRAVYALRRAISAVCAVACAASAMVFAMPSERLRCITMPCAPAWPDPMAARPMARIVTRYDMRRILARVVAGDGAEQPIELGNGDCVAQRRERPLTRD